MKMVIDEIPNLRLQVYKRETAELWATIVHEIYTALVQ